LRETASERSSYYRVVDCADGPSKGLLMVGMHGSYIAFMKFGNRVYLRATERISDPEVPKMTVMVTGAADCEAGDSIPPGQERSPTRSARPQRPGFGEPRFRRAGRHRGGNNYRTLTARAHFRTTYLAIS
jgi:hypothetical protein